MFEAGEKGTLAASKIDAGSRTAFAHRFRVRTLGRVVRSVSEKRIERAVREIAPLSVSALALVRLTNDPSHAAEDIVRVVDQDASLTIRLLRIANSPVIAPAAPIESVEHAISLLGERTVVSAALSIGANWMLAPLSGYGPDATLFDIGLKTAVAARLVATHIGSEELVAVAYTGGLLHDIGKAVLAELFDPRAQAVARDPGSGTAADRLAAEKEAFGVTHCELGVRVADQFGLGPALRAVIEHYHVPNGAAPEHRRLVEIVHVADGVCAMLGGEGHPESPAYPAYPADLAVFEKLGIRESDLSGIISATLEESSALLEVVSFGGASA